MTDFNRIFLDSAPFIYLLEKGTPFTDKMEKIMQNLLSRNIAIMTSSVTVAEYCVHPYREHNIEKLDKFFAFLRDIGIETINIDDEIAKLSAEIRATYSFKGMDALQLASAQYHHCDVFLTNDKQLKRFAEVNCVMIEEYPFDVT